MEISESLVRRKVLILLEVARQLSLVGRSFTYFEHVEIVVGWCAVSQADHEMISGELLLCLVGLQDSGDEVTFSF